MRGDRQNHTRSSCRPVTHSLTHSLMKSKFCRGNVSFAMADVGHRSFKAPSEIDLFVQNRVRYINLEVNALKLQEKEKSLQFSTLLKQLFLNLAYLSSPDKS